MIVIATPEEMPLVSKEMVRQYGPVLITGIGALNVINALQLVPRETQIINIGYAGSNTLSPKTICKIGKVKLYHPVADFEDAEFVLVGNIPCYTAGDFVTHTEIKEPCVFDMELAYILALGFKNVQAVKVVSDNLAMKEYEKTISGKAVIVDV